MLVDPKQQRFFKANDLKDLFSLSVPDKEGGTETGDLFAGLDNVELTRKEVSAAGNIDLLDKVADYQSQESPEETNDEQDILKSLFDKGVHSALQHDVIVGSTTREILLVEKEASLVASKAVAALKASRQRIRNEQRSSSSGVILPTWTGRFGSTGAPRRFGGGASGGASSASILSNLRDRNLEPVVGGGVESIGDVDINEVDKIQKFLAGREGRRASTKDIVAGFKKGVMKSEEVALFRKMLKGVAEFDKGSKMWTLKREFW